jgi:hypothetical protein
MELETIKAILLNLLFVVVIAGFIIAFILDHLHLDKEISEDENKSESSTSI